MEAEDRPLGLYTEDVHGDGQRQISRYTETPQQFIQQSGPSRGFPVHTSNMTRMPYYAPPSGVAAHGDVSYGALASASLPQRPVTVVGTNPPMPMAYVEQSFVGAIIYSCLVLWLCNIAFGWAALVLARE